MEVREMLTQYEFDGTKALFVKGSALAALEGRDPDIGVNAIDKLVAAMDAAFEPAKKEIDKPFLLMVDSSLNI
jgi:elongation factor Tu